MAEANANLGRFLHAIADPTRRRILHALKEHALKKDADDKNSNGKGAGLCAGDIEALVKLAQPTVSHHMQILERAGVVEAQRQGHWRWYRRNEKVIAEMAKEIKSQL
jgi:DNA-binding transcriptional ArsR family regulator